MINTCTTANLPAGAYFDRFSIFLSKQNDQKKFSRIETRKDYDPPMKYSIRRAI
jgi:hypothetical protein